MPESQLRTIAEIFPKTTIEFGKYLTEIEPPMDINCLAARIVIGEDRKSLRIPTDGDLSLFLSYRGKDAAVCSAKDTVDTLVLTQFQGRHGRIGYRLNGGLRWVSLTADQMLGIASDPQTPYRRIALLPLFAMGNVTGAASYEGVQRKHEEAMARLRLSYSKEECLFVRDL